MSCKFINSVAVTLAFFLASGASAESSAEEFIPQLTDCASFFGLLSQSSRKSADSFKTIAAAFSLYAVEVVPKAQLETEFENSKHRIGLMVSEAKLKDDQSAVSMQAEACFVVLRKAEILLWPKLPELSKSLAPRILIQE